VQVRAVRSATLCEQRWVPDQDSQAAWEEENLLVVERCRAKTKRVHEVGSGRH